MQTAVSRKLTLHAAAAAADSANDDDDDDRDAYDRKDSLNLD